MWPNQWCQLNDLEDEQATSTLAAVTKLNQLFDWRGESSFNWFRNYTEYLKKSKTKRKELLKADEIDQAEQVLIQFVQNEGFMNVSKSMTSSSKISITLSIAKLSRFKEDVSIWVTNPLKHSNIV